jgi:hypothetical protein
MKFNYQLILTLVTFFSVSTAKSEGRRFSLRRLHDQPVETNLELIEGDKLALPREDEEDEMGPVDTNFEAENEIGPVDTNFEAENEMGAVDTNFEVENEMGPVDTNFEAENEMGAVDTNFEVENEIGPVDTNFEAENEMGPVDTNFKGPVTTNFAVSWGDSTVTTNESGDVVIQKTNRDLYCKSFPEGKNKEDLAITLIHSTTWRDYIGSMYFQASYAMLNDSEEKNICSISIEVPKSNEDMKVFLSAGVEFDKERTSKGELKSDLLNKSVYMEPADSFSFFYTLSERTDSVESTAVPLICVKDFEYCTEKQTEDRVSLHDYSQQ